MLRAGGPHYYRLAPDSDIGGELYERRLIERLPAQGVELVLGLPRDHQAADLPSGVRVDVLPHGRSLHWLRAPAVFVPWTARLLRHEGIELLRGHSVRYCGPSLLIARRITRAPVPVVLHHHHFTPRWQRLEAAILRRADAVVTVSERSRAALLEAGLRADRVHVVLDGVDRPARAGRLDDAWPQAGLRLLHLGRLEPRKNALLAIAALTELRKRGIAAALVLAGDGPERPELERHVAERNLGASVRFLGRVADTVKWQLLDSADVLLFASTLEGFGLVVAEAQSRGLPVVAARGTATAEALRDGHSGVLAAPTAVAFADAVELLDDEQTRRSMSAEAAQFANRFSWEACAAGVAAVYRSVVAR